MAEQEMIAHCLTYPDAYEDYPFDEEWAVICRKENRKSFALVYERSGHPCVDLKCKPVSAGFLRLAFSGVVPAYCINKVHWSAVLLGGEVPWDELQQMVHQGYELIRPKQRHGG